MEERKVPLSKSVSVTAKQRLDITGHTLVSSAIRPTHFTHTPSQIGLVYYSARCPT